MRQRYRKSKKIQKVTEDETYFNPNKASKKQKGYLST